MNIDGINKIFMIGDLHYGIRNNSMVWKNDMMNFMNKFIEALPRHGFNPETDILMLSGDIFHSREFLNVMVGNAALELFQRACAIFKRGIYVIPGNHDMYFKRDNSVHTLKFIEGSFENFKVFSEPEELVINGKINFLMLPWHDDVEYLDAEIAKHTDSEYLFCHMDIAGFKYNKAVKVDRGLTIERLKSFKRVYAGHLHHKQESANILYLGTPYQLDFGDTDTVRGYYVMNIVDNMISEEFFVNEWSPKFVSCMFDDIMEMTFEELARQMHCNHVNLHVPSSAARNFSYNTFAEMLQLNGIVPRKIDYKQYDDSYEIDESKFDATSDFNLATAAKAILEEKKYTHTEIENVLSYFNNLHTLAKNNEKEELRDE